MPYQRKCERGTPFSRNSIPTEITLSTRQRNTEYAPTILLYHKSLTQSRLLAYATSKFTKAFQLVLTEQPERIG